ncbi:4-oxalocrotonate tautomerase [Virgibacillus pantothenticus]|uniref:4-oxalocrotonate tautomerase n=1 Tax=Virgibacillus TaxID=84406 RepID=UPI00090B67AE|nr:MULTISPECIES: 4-oxalocrotonate tautomerase [Virgibacillus]API92020.1 4-oxalocrotonate tautomerase [Virgibacillus sp. 6R]MBS7430483.1 4-oxalocrotonate tautomerase [Virgibacillus sp. 19R1-5]MBU8566421.1 4-oxalocrotonate tautomerase [Virgibacillus pantothenticus]MBU8600164.1 4-oxalocrotonate tautomerase [Virgibacillus pantothenticus]MBU8633904.1 4-oxalocrotonate tautomerase [Virgibacillus pantothenticus]
MPIITIQIMEGRSPEKIEALINNVTDMVSKSLTAPKENIRVLVHEIPKSHWGIGGTTAKKMGR